MAEKKLARSSNKKIAGVCAGLANYFGWDPTMVRAIYAILTICTAFCGVVIYLILWILLPQE